MTRKRMKHKKIPRDWKSALAKTEAEGRCRYCKAPGDSFCLDTSHTVGRRFQDAIRVGPRGGKTTHVSPLAVVPLCNLAINNCHRAYDAHEISLVGLLSLSEYRNAYRACKKWGLDFRRRISGGKVTA